jgi:Transglutaminase-like superfamily
MRVRGEQNAAGSRSRWPTWARPAGWLLLWTWWVCYPNPLIFVRNFLRYAHFPIDATIIDRVPFPVPRAPQSIEAAVREGVRYEFDWRQYGVPWYVPTPQEVIRTCRGDCESRAVVLASLLEARGIPFRLQASPVHIWVEYPGKEPNADENTDIAMMRREHGRYRFRLPSLLRLRDDCLLQKEALWDVMPRERKVALLGGWVLLIMLPWLRRRAASGERAGVKSSVTPLSQAPTLESGDQ